MTDDPRVEAAVAGIRDDRTRGAAELARAALDVLRLAADPTGGPGTGQAIRARVEATGRRIVRSRPSMASVVNAVAACVGRLPVGCDITAADVAEAASATRTDLEAAAQGVVECSQEFLAGVRRVVTLSYSSSVAAVLKGIEVGEIVVGEGRPGLEGRHLARLLRAGSAGVGSKFSGCEQRAGRRVTLVTDAQLGRCLKPETVVLVGADTLLPDGSVVNKAGTLLVAAWAAAIGARVVVGADTSKLAAWWRPGDPVDLEDSAPDEIWPDPPHGVGIENVLFDHTPARFVTAYLTERGALSTDQLGVTAGELAKRRAPVYQWRE